MKRTTLSLIAGATALAAVTGFAALTAPEGTAAPEAAKATTRLPVERVGLACPAPSTSEVAETVYTSYTPAGTEAGKAPEAGKDGAGQPTALLRPAAGATADGGAGDGKKPAAAKAPATVTVPGKPVTAEADGAAVPALTGSATGALAPGWTVQQTTVVPAGGSRGLLGLTCGAPDTDFWFPAASTAQARHDYVHLTNPDDTAAVADIELYGPEGLLKSQFTEGIPVPAHSTVPVLLSTLTADAPSGTSPSTSPPAAGASARPSASPTTSSAATGSPPRPTRRAAPCFPASRPTPPRCGSWSSPPARTTPT